MNSYKDAFNQEPSCIDGLNFEYLNDGLNDFVMANRTIHSYFRRRDSHELIIFLSAVGLKGKPYPIFHRVSWENHFDGNILCFDDPTRNEIDFAPCFYFGDAQHNLLEQINAIVCKIAQNLNIKNKDIFIISSSNGGFAAMYLANKILDSTCIALCPQFDVDLFFDGNKLFYSKLNINRDDYLHRLNLFDVIDNDRSKFIIYSNIMCPSDKIQIDSFCSSHGISYKIGLNIIKSNFFLIISKINAVHPHTAQKDRLLINDFIDVYLQLLKSYYEQELCNQITNKVNQYLSNIKRIEFHDDFIDIFVNDVINSFFRIYDFRNEKIIVSFRIKNFTKYLAIEQVWNWAKKHNFAINNTSSDINIYSKYLIHFSEIGFWYNEIMINCFNENLIFHQKGKIGN